MVKTPRTSESRGGVRWCLQPFGTRPVLKETNWKKKGVLGGSEWIFRTLVKGSSPGRTKGQESVLPSCTGGSPDEGSFPTLSRRRNHRDPIKKSDNDNGSRQ